MEEVAGYLGLFATAFLAATVFPAQSEFLLAGLHLSGSYDDMALIAVASVGNVLGSTVNWVLGRCITRFQGRRWFPVKPGMLIRATAWYQRFGFWSLLLSWVPVIGDPLTLVAGVLRVNLWLFLLVVSVAKTARYMAVVAAI